MRGFPALKTLAPHHDSSPEQTGQLQLQLFGKIPNEDLHTEHQFNLDNLAHLVYLPLSPTRIPPGGCFGSNKFTCFVQEVTPHEVAHQWWGHAVGWASCHDQWLSEGFAEFSAGFSAERGTGRKTT